MVLLEFIHSLLRFRGLWLCFRAMDNVCVHDWGLGPWLGFAFSWLMFRNLWLECGAKVDV